MSLSDRIVQRALELGFDRTGIAPAAPLPHAPALGRWIEAGHQGEMRYMARNPEVRADPAALMEGARSVVAHNTLRAISGCMAPMRGHAAHRGAVNAHQVPACARIAAGTADRMCARPSWWA